MTTEASLVGRWRLDWYRELDAATGEKISDPFGASPNGRLLYTARGHMSVHLARTDGQTHGVDYYFGYTGSYTLDGDFVVHQLEISSHPDLTGAQQRRAVRFEGDRLTLSTPEYEVEGRKRVAALSWVRA
ncbi:lipocalin-like domain-containing protein [Crossiella sp. SN42]|uniref:lipocalin-like domain-containing protein n=1 Tax=Crossiella sp. SN42 TaxID=2944808 RepID=UPI00207C530F|nr:lipocalin-like domain-containing protein [Crossiella sp. SN42]MCO1575670.1 lipocalin-like domain-containing protein [Crossiella sp. SN42]